MVKAYVEGLYVGLLLAAEASRRQAMSQHIGHGTALCCRAVDILVVAGIGKLLDVHAEKEARLVRCGEPALGPRLPGSYGASKSCAWALVVCCKAGKQTRWKTARREW